MYIFWQANRHTVHHEIVFPWSTKSYAAASLAAWYITFSGGCPVNINYHEIYILSSPATCRLLRIFLKRPLCYLKKVAKMCLLMRGLFCSSSLWSIITGGYFDNIIPEIVLEVKATIHTALMCNITTHEPMCSIKLFKPTKLPEGCTEKGLILCSLMRGLLFWLIKDC